MLRLIAGVSISTIILYENRDHLAKFVYQVTYMTAKRAGDAVFKWFNKNL